VLFRMTEHVVFVKLINNIGGNEMDEKTEVVDEAYEHTSLEGKFHPWFNDYAIFVGVLSTEKGSGKYLAQNVLDQFQQTFWECDWKDNIFFDNKTADEMDDPLTCFEYVFHTYRNGERTLFSGYNYRTMEKIKHNDQEPNLIGGLQFYVTTGKAFTDQEFNESILRAVERNRNIVAIDIEAKKSYIQG
jgi:hypothetical protein